MVQAVLVLICVALCVVWHMALRLGSASMAMNDVPARNRGGGRHSGLVCVVRRASVRPAQMPCHSKAHFRAGDQ
jgi:hypothetical protein